jgi:hypothetical protein
MKESVMMNSLSKQVLLAVVLVSGLSAQAMTLEEMARSQEIVHKGLCRATMKNVDESHPFGPENKKVQVLEYGVALQDGSVTTLTFYGEDRLQQAEATGVTRLRKCDVYREQSKTTLD